VYKGITESGKVEVHHMVQIYDGVSVYAKEALRVQSPVYVFDRHSMFEAGSEQVELKQVAVTLNPQYVTDWH